MKPDRRVHASHPSGIQIVRYDRQGKWYVEQLLPGEPTLRTHVTLDVAVDTALLITSDNFGLIFWGTRGGATFDRRFQQVRAATSPERIKELAEAMTRLSKGELPEGVTDGA